MIEKAKGFTLFLFLFFFFFVTLFWNLARNPEKNSPKIRAEKRKIRSVCEWISEYSLIQSQTLRILQFFLRIFDEFFSGFRAKFQKIVTSVAFSIKFAKTNQKFAENSEFCEKKFTIIQNYSLHSLVATDSSHLLASKVACGMWSGVGCDFGLSFSAGGCNLIRQTLVKFVTKFWLNS